METRRIGQRSPPQRNHQLALARKPLDRLPFTETEVLLTAKTEELADGHPFSLFDRPIDIRKTVPDRVCQDRADRAFPASHESGKVDTVTPDCRAARHRTSCSPEILRSSQQLTCTFLP